MDYGKALRVARALAGLQQQELAEAAEIDASYISLIEQGRRTPSLRFINRLSHALGIPPHLFSFLAIERDDTEFLDTAELEAIGESLTKLVLEYGKSRTNKPRRKRSKRTRGA